MSFENKRKYYLILTFGAQSCLFLGRKAMTNLDSILNSRDITLLIKVQIIKRWFFHVRVGLSRKLSAEELMLLNCGIENS